MYQLKQAFSQMGRNKGMYFTTIMAITAMMLLLGLFYIAFVNLECFTDTIQEDYNVIQVYLVDKMDAAEKQETEYALEDLKGVESVEFVSKDEALETLKERWGENAYLLDNMKENPLPNSYLVYVKDKDSANYVAEEAPKLDKVDDVVYYQDTIEKLAAVSNFIEKGSLIVMAFLIIISVVIVANTIKLTVFNREKEIGIMKYLGATDWFVRAPFIWGGIIIGIISSAVASGLIYFVYKELIKLLGADIARILSVTIVSADELIMNIAIIFVSLGVGIGACGSIISIRRFLDK